MSSSILKVVAHKHNRSKSLWLLFAVFIVVCLLGVVSLAYSAIHPVTSLEQCEPLKLLVVLGDLSSGAELGVIRQPAPDSILTSAGASFSINGNTVYHQVFWHRWIWNAHGNFVNKADFPFEIGANGVKEDIPEGIVLSPLHADESHMGCGMTVIGRVCAFAARYSNIVTWLQVELDSDNRVDEFAHLLGVIDARMQSCIAND